MLSPPARGHGAPKGGPLHLRLLICVVLAGLCLPANAALAQGGGPIMPLSQVRPGMQCTGETVIQGTTISSFGVQVIDIVQASGRGTEDPVRVSGPAVARTASPKDSRARRCTARLVGTMRERGRDLREVGEFGNNAVLVTPIELMLGEPVTPPTDRRGSPAGTRPVARAADVAGLSAVGVRPGRAGRRRAPAELVVAARPATARPELPGAATGPGRVGGRQLFSGDVPMGAVGTVTYVDGPTVYAFGHELDGAGRRSLMLQDATLLASSTTRIRRSSRATSSPLPATPRALYRATRRTR